MTRLNKLRRTSLMLAAASLCFGEVAVMAQSATQVDPSIPYGSPINTAPSSQRLPDYSRTTGDTAGSAPRVNVEASHKPQPPSLYWPSRVRRT